MLFAGLDLARRLEAAEGDGCLKFAQAHARLAPEDGCAWRQIGGANVVFDGPESPVTQTFGLGLFEPATAAILDEIEDFFRSRGAPVAHEVCPLAGIETVQLLNSRGYRPIEFGTVLVQEVDAAAFPPLPPGITVRAAGADEADVWAEVAARGWAAEIPDLYDFLLNMGRIQAEREDSMALLGVSDSIPGAAAGLCLHEGVALFAGAATVPELRRRGLQRALLGERMRIAAARECDIAMMGAAPGSTSQRNAERAGFRVAYTRTKWLLA